MRSLLIASIIFFASIASKAQAITNDGTQTIFLKQGEAWFGAAVNEGDKMPFTEGYTLNLYADNRGNQSAPFLLSSKGRFILSENPFEFIFRSNQLIISKTYGKIIIDSSSRTLREAFQKASKQFFPASGKLPDSLLFLRLQYNTWIELTYNQNQVDILKYAHSIIDNGFPAGVLMIDDNWMPYYGNFSFRKDKFPDAEAMMEELHALGFKVMVWVCPFISLDTEVFRELTGKKILLLDNENNPGATWQQAQKPVIINWWNGYSAELDFTNPGAVTWYRSQLDSMQSKYKVDGFKFDAGDMEYYPLNAVSFRKATPNEQCELWGTFGNYFSLNEYWAMWKRGGEPLAERLRDKEHNWRDVQKLIPDIITSGLLGYQFTCPDMIGGGEYGSFIGRDKLDQDIVVRSAQTSALMPMMQFSVAPWRVLDSVHLDAVKKAVNTRMQFTAYIYKLIRESAISGEPVVRSLEYVFPNQGFEKIKDQFMLGDKLMITPMVDKGYSRKVVFPRGIWKGDDGKIVHGPASAEIKVPVERLPVFEFIQK